MKRFFRLPTVDYPKSIHLQQIVDELVKISEATVSMGERVLILEIRPIAQDQILLPLLEHKETI
jgi:hypothetical protein